MSNLVSKFKDFWFGDVEEYNSGFEGLFRPSTVGSDSLGTSLGEEQSRKLPSAHSHLKVIDDYVSTNEVVVIEPSDFSEAVDIIQYLKRGASIVLNLANLAESESQRLLDFVCGGVFALDGSQKRVGEGVFLLVPNSVSISAAVTGKSDSSKSQFWS